MKHLLLGTTNPAKVNFVRTYLASLPIKVLSLKDLNIDLDVAEEGASPEENARIKAQAYFSVARISTLAIDAGLHIEKFAEEKQPGIFVRRLRSTGQPASDEALLDYYARELDDVGGRSPGTWDVSVALMVSDSWVFVRTFELRVLFTAQRSTVRIPGAPLSSLMIDPASGCYFAELPTATRPDAGPIRDFVQQHFEDV